jgi:transglutaminase-like putative cysteine protease
MMHKPAKTLTVCFLILISGCTERHLINNSVYLSDVESAFSERKNLAANRKVELFSVFNNQLSAEQTEALKFLFAYSPLNDLADYNGDFFLANADLALKSRATSNWGNKIPEDIFLHYVLPFRVNNENLDSFRIVFYNEINKRIKGLDPYESSLEINHWCHEKVSYQPADIRTSGPLSTILSARGRCGEESTFTVAALRTAGIPARQVYTPRWAHSDDNHAWVEVWIDGKWFYMGACEPEPDLDRGWFTEPAKRAMLIHTKSFGAPAGNENAIIKNKNFTEVNNLSKYAVTKEIFVRVLDSLNLPVPDAIVEYQLYNYAEFYPLAMVPTDKDGLSRFETGLGDLIIWTRKNNAFNFKKISVNEIDTLTLRLDRKAHGDDFIELDLGVPIVRNPTEGPGANLIAENNNRLIEENSIRKKYTDTWMKPEEAETLAIKNGYEPKAVKEIISKSMGNYKNISVFLENSPSSHKTLAITLLNLIAEKDLRDTPSRVLSDHLNNCIHLLDSGKNIVMDLYNQYVLNPRIANEILSPWRGYFLKNISKEIATDGKKDPTAIVKFLDNSIKISDAENYYNTPITPRGVYELKVSDSFSRDICFVAICRSLGIPSRLEPASNLPQFFNDGKWNDVYFSNSKRKLTGKGFVRLVSNDKNPVPEYYIHFTLARFENGRYNTLEFDNNKKVTDFKNELLLASGHYMIVTGNRIDDSRILSAITFFDLMENEHKTLKIEIRKDNSPIEIFGSVNLKTQILSSGNRKISLDSLVSKGLVISWVDPDKEPTKHILNDLPLLKPELDKWGGHFLFLTDRPENDIFFSSKVLSGLPVKSLIGKDQGLKILNSLLTTDTLKDARLPYVILINNKGNIIFRSEGYRIGIGEQILKKNR